MKKEIIVIGIVLIVVGAIFVPISRMISETNKEWVLNGTGYSGHPFPHDVYLSKEERWTVEITRNGQDYEPQSTVKVQLYDYLDNLVYDVPYETLKVMPHGWNPISVDGWYTMDVKWGEDSGDSDGLSGTLLPTGIGYFVGAYSEKTEIVYPYESLFFIGLGSVIAGVSTSIIGALARKPAQGRKKSGPHPQPVVEKKKPPISASIEAKVVYCVYCGEKLPPKAVYCRKCGEKTK